MKGAKKGKRKTENGFLKVGNKWEILVEYEYYLLPTAYCLLP